MGGSLFCGGERADMPKRFRAAYLELTNRCNRHCAFCWGSSREPGFMDPALFSKLAPQVAELAEIAYLHILGEALLHPDLERITAFAKEAGLPLGMTTNGTLFDHPNARILDDPVYRRLNISLHSGVTDSELERIFEFSEELLSTNANVHIDYRLWDRGSDRSVRERIADRYPVVRETPADGGKRVQLLRRLFLHEDRPFEWPEADAPRRSEKGFCHGGVFQFGVLLDGRVTACCLDADGILNFGSAAERRLSEILFARRFEQMRNGFLRGEVLEDFCLRCRYRERFSSSAV